MPAINEGVLRRSHGILAAIAHRYFRSEIRGLEHIPREPSIIVTHHDGGVLPVNGICFGVHWYEHLGFGRPLYVLTHEFIHKLSSPFAHLLKESGVIPADREAMDAALAAGVSVLVFPGAARETFRTYWRRRDIDLGGRTGFVAQAIRWGRPITPVVSAGAHETLFVLATGRALAKALGVPKLVRSADVFPLLLGLPWGLWAVPFLPQIPLPAKITSEILDPIWLPSELGRPLSREDADDEETVSAGYRIVLSRMRAALDRLYRERRWPVIG